ncbi:MAG: glutathione peroxidase [Phycisphaerales bacterium]|jgi:glutathione peroxidase|nr:glutathione peroxidase [Phycisphaerales bacterium]
MILRLLILVVVCIAVGMIVLKARQVMGKDVVKDPGAATQPAGAAADAPPSPLAFTVKDIDGKDYDLAQLKGKVVMLVNVASKCGFTKQYAGLEKLYEKYKDRGLVIIGFPANNFGGQEPGSAEEIKTFCSTKYHVTFPMMSKISVKGENQHPLYDVLTHKSAAPFRGDVGWNFTKFLVDRNGQVFARFASKTTPEDEQLVAAVEKALGPTKAE